MRYGIGSNQRDKKEWKIWFSGKKILRKNPIPAKQYQEKKKVKSNPDVLVCQVDMEHQQFWSIRGVL